MKRKRLLFAAIALVAGALNINAQGWTASEVGAGSFYLYNVGAQGYVVGGNNWGTRATITTQGGILTTLVGSENAYEIQTSPTFNGRHLGYNGFVDNGDANQIWTFEAVEGESNVYKLKTSSGTYLFADAGATTTTVGADPGTDYAKWKLVTRANRIADLANASASNPIDATFLLTNPNFDRNSNTGTWNGGVALGGNNENYCAEKFNTTFDVNQTVTDAPKGKYVLAFQGFYRYGGHGITPAGDARKAGTEQLNTKLYANDTEAPLMSILDEPNPAAGDAVYDGVAYPNSMSHASSCFSAGQYSTDMTFTVDANTIKIGVKKTVAVTNDWTIFDNCRLTYYGAVVDLSIYVENLATAVANAEALYDQLPTTEKADLQAVVAEYNKTYTTADDYIAAIGAIKAETEVAEALVAPYAAWKETKATAESDFAGNTVVEAIIADKGAIVEAAKAAETITGATAELQAILDVVGEYTVIKEYAQNLYDVADYTENVDGAHDALGTAITENSGTYTTAEQFTAATAALKAAATTYAADADPKGDAKFDLTFMLTNPDVTEYWDGTWGVQPEGWYNEQNGGNFQVMANEEMGPGGEIFMEYWSENAATNGFVLCQKVTLPEGAYQMAGRVGVRQYDAHGTTTNVTFSANEVDGTQIPFGGLTDGSIEFINNAEQEVKIGLKAHAGNNTRWMGINKIHLYKIAPKAFIIDENATENIIAAGAGDVKLTRTIKVGMNSVVLPFQLTAEDIVTLGGEGAVAYTVTEYANDNLKLAEATTIQPNVPFFLKATAAGTEFDFEGKTIAAEVPVVPVGDATLVGTYAKIDAVPYDSYILSGGKFYLVNSTVSLKPTRAYITIAEPTEVSALGFTIEDATAIVGVESEVANSEVYDIAGRKVSAPVRGLYIANGKKVLVK